MAVGHTLLVIVYQVLRDGRRTGSWGPTTSTGWSPSG